MADLPKGRTALEEQLGLDLAIDAERVHRLLGARRAARWFLQTHAWDELDERIAEMLTRYEPPIELVLPGVVELLRDAHLEGRTSLAILELPPPPCGSAAITDICHLLDADACFELWTDECSSLLVPHGSLPRIRRSVDVEFTAVGPLAEIALVWGSDDDEAQRFAVALVRDLLEQGEIDIAADRWHAGLLSVIVPHHQALLAAGALDRIPARLAPLLPGVPSPSREAGHDPGEPQRQGARTR